MAVDYKYSKYQQMDRRRSPSGLVLKILVLIVLLAIVVYGTYFFTTRKANQMILTGQYSEATKSLSRWKWLPLVNASVYERLGTSELLAKNNEPAKRYFDRAKNKIFFRPASIWNETLKVLWANGRYSDGMIYVEHIQEKLADEKSLHFYKSGFLAGSNQLAEASKALQEAGSIPELSKEISQLRAEIDQRAATRRYPLAYDRENLPLVTISLDGKPNVVADPVRPLLQNTSGDYVAILAANPQRQAVLSIDYRMQNEALKALGKYAGAIVLLDPRTGEILAAAGNSKGLHSEHPANESTALDTFYEPGSIIKMITLAGAIEKGLDLSSVFPLKCEGLLPLSEQRILYDWMVHRVVKDYDVATAVSCNVSFARIGMAMKPADLIANLRQFGFDSRLQNAFLPLNTGRIKSATITDEYLAKLSIGLDYLEMTPLHAAMLASSIANGGKCMTPRLLLHYRNIIGLPYGQQSPVLYRAFMKEQTASMLTHAMQQVVVSPDGTGRRAAMQNFAIALKTGTAGEGSKGYNAIMIGFGPVPNPKIAFAVVIEHAGKAEWEGARVTKLFLESIQSYIK